MSAPTCPPTCPAVYAGLQLKPTFLALAAAALFGAPALALAACPKAGASLYGATSAGFMPDHAIPHTGVAATLDACRDLCSADPSCAAFQFSEELATATAALAKYGLPMLSVGGVGLPNYTCGLKSALSAALTDEAHQKTFSWSAKLPPSVACGYHPAREGARGQTSRGNRVGQRRLFPAAGGLQQCADLCSLPTNARSCVAFTFKQENGACDMHTEKGARKPYDSPGWAFRRKIEPPTLPALDSPAFCFADVPTKGYIEGYDLGAAENVADVAECIKLCALNIKCTAMHYLSTTKLCGLKTGGTADAVTQTYMKLWVAYVKKPSAERPSACPGSTATCATGASKSTKTATYTQIGRCCRPAAGFDKVVEQVKNLDVKSCQAACTQNPACHAVQAKKRACYLQLTPTRAAPGCSSSCYAAARPCACAAGKFKAAGTTVAQACEDKKTEDACTSSQMFTAGADSVKDRDDTTCTTCADGKYKSSKTACSAKTTTCPAAKFLYPGADSVKDRDDTTCTGCANGKFKTGTTTAQSCEDKTTTCPAAKFLYPGADSKKAKDDAKCSTCDDGKFQAGTNSATSCSVKTATCPAAKFLYPGADSEKAKDDATCSTCDDGKFKAGTNSATSCSAKTTTCPEGKFFSPLFCSCNAKSSGSPLKDRDDATCTACAGGKFKVGTTADQACEDKTKEDACTSSQIFTAGADSEKAKNDAKCATCDGGKYKSSNTACSAKTMTTCPAGKFLYPGANSVKDRDDSTCTRCPTAKFKVGTTTHQSCNDKKTDAFCSHEQKFTAGADVDGLLDDSTCTTCEAGEYKSSKTACSAKKTTCPAGKFLFPGDFNGVKDRDDATCSTCDDGKFKAGTTTAQSCEVKTTKADCTPAAKFFNAGDDSVKDKDDASCTAAPKVAADCIVDNMLCTASSRPSPYSTFIYWRALRDSVGGTYKGTACSYGSSAAESLCACQYKCQQDEKCRAFEVTDDNQATCHLFTSLRCDYDTGSKGTEFYGKCPKA